MLCKICNSNVLIENKMISVLCKECKILYNLQTKPLDYTNGGGQDVPSGEKSRVRVLNAKKRFEIIHPHMKAHNIFIDIGCGSGEMLEASKEFFENHIGYDENKSLISYTAEKKLNTYTKYFDKKDLKIFKNQGIVISINHVLEHVEFPMNMLKNIIDNMEDNDILYIEVPLWTGYSFKSMKYNWALWYDEHLALYSLETLKTVSKNLNMDILDIGNRNFITDNFSKRAFFTFLFKHPIKFISSFLTKKKYHLYLDNFYQDYGFVVLKKKKYETIFK